MPRAGIYRNPISYVQNSLKGRSDKLTSDLKKVRDNADLTKSDPTQSPFLSSGGRTFITVAGIPVAVCLDFSYSVSIDQEEVRTIDNQFPVDINLGQVKIAGKLSRFVDPEGSLEEKGLFHTMQASLHQPIVEILVQDANGNAMFFCKGMFVSMDARYALGQLSVNSANFVGIQYQHWANQEFTPYSPNSVQSRADKMLNDAKNKLKGLGL